MKQYGSIEYIKIAVANHYGLDKQTFDARIAWFDSFSEQQLNAMVKDADEPILMEKMLRTYNHAKRGISTGALVGLDATASGLQILACLIGCHDTARATNLIFTGKREDVYQKIADHMSQEIGHNIPRSKLKKPLMTTFYGSKEQPKLIFGEDSKELGIFYEMLEKDLGGALEVMADMQSCWQGDALAHTWTLPDGHVAHVPVMDEATHRVEVDELDHTTFTHKAYVNARMESGISLAANITHSIDGYVVREMIRRANKQGFELLAIHDSFQKSAFTQ